MENKSRFEANIQFTKAFNSGMTYYTNEGFVVLLKDKVGYDSFWHHYHHYKTLKHDFTLKYHRFDVSFMGDSLNKLTSIKKELPNSTRFHFYKGSDPNKWSTNVRAYGKITYQNLYPGIDWEIISFDELSKHNFLVKKKANPNQIVMKYSFAEHVKIENKCLIIETSVGKVIEQEPYAFQIIHGDTIQVECFYKLSKHKDYTLVSFQIGAYQNEYDLIIDPVLVFSSYSGSEGDNFGFTSTHDSKSNLYGAGIVDGGTGTNGGPFPVTVGAFQTVYSGGQGLSPANLPCDIGINKFDSAGNTLLYSTYLGGSRDEYPHSLVVDNFDNLLIMGTTYSNGFPVTPDAYDNSYNGQTDIFVVKLTEDGSDMIGGTYFGGTSFDGLNRRTLRYNYADDFRGDIIVDKDNNVYIASTTESNNFPVKNAIQDTRASAQDGCVFSFDDSLKKLRFSTYLGGNNDDAAYSIRMYDTFIYVGGGTASNAVAFAVNGHKNTYSGGRADGFIAKLTYNGFLINSTYFGTNTYDQIFFLDIDKNGSIYASGQTEGSLSRSANTYGSDNKSQFIVRYSPNLANINLTTTFGNRNNNPELSPSAFLVDRCDNIYFSGWGSPIDYDGLHSLTTQGLPVTSNAIQPTTDNKDFYLFVLSKNANSLLYATYFGGDKTDDHVDGGTSRFDKRGVVYQSVCASCPETGGNQDFPVTSNVPFRNNPSPRCSNAVFKIDFQINFIVDAKFSATPKEGCLPVEVNFTNLSKYAKSFQWNFGDGSPIDTNRNTKHLFEKPGSYKVKLTSIDSFSCNISEEDSVIIIVKDVPKADFEFETVDCSREISFINKSSDFVQPQWDFGDSTDLVFEENPKHTFLKDGKFKIILQVKHPNSDCVDTQSLIIDMTSDPTKTLKVPNVFTPNFDSKNDCYTIDGIMPGCDEAEIWIYDRWGILVFNGFLPQDCWLGTIKNNRTDLSSGVYYYILELKSKRPEFKNKEKYSGVIHLIR
ncbi:MAG: gliding motility-associated C-terminal domain-containing protein [Bacteroidota bacterium]|nr:gliding motility-associated C-terminal domain-containing protein [Bacteroidota bacterium]